MQKIEMYLVRYTKQHTYPLAPLVRPGFILSPVPGRVQCCPQASSGGTAFFSTTKPHPAKVEIGSRRDAFSEVRFKREDVPSFNFWARRARPPLVSDLSPEECLAAARGYVDLAVEGAPNWRRKLTTERHISLYTLHYLAAMIITGPPSPAWHMALHMLHTGVQLSYTPSVLTLVRLAHMRNVLGQAQFSQAEEAFARILARRDDPNACTLQGLILAAQDKPSADAKALQWFLSAIQIGGEEPRAWDWQPSCFIGLAKIYLKQGKKGKAQETLRHAAADLDMPEACWLYANTFDQDDAERMVWLKKAAVSGNLAAARELGQATLRELNVDNLSSEKRKERQLLADEWLAIAGDKALV